MVKLLSCFRHFDADLFVVVQGARQFHKEPDAGAIFNKVQHRAAERHPEREAIAAVNTSHTYRIDKR